MRNSIRLLPAFALVALTATTARAFVIDAHPRVFNDIPTSSLTFTTGADSAVISDQNVSAPSGGANRHDAAISDGPSGEVFNNTDYFTLSADVTLTGTPESPRKEAGLRVNNVAGGDFLFIINTDGHEVVAFGGPGPFYNFRDHGVPNYVSGNTINMGINYCQDPDGSIDPITGNIRNGVQLFAGGVSSPFLPMFNLENGFLSNSQIAMYGQVSNAPNDPQNGMVAAFNNVRFNRTDGSCIPEPSSLALLASGLLPLLGLRRRK